MPRWRQCTPFIHSLLIIATTSHALSRHHRLRGTLARAGHHRLSIGKAQASEDVLHTHRIFLDLSPFTVKFHLQFFQLPMSYSTYHSFSKKVPAWSERRKDGTISAVIITDRFSFLRMKKPIRYRYHYRL